jgi:hypothetical protein
MPNSKAIRTEAKFQALMKRDLEIAGAIVFNVCGGNSFQSAGWPDLLVFHGDLTKSSCGLELKMHGGATRTIQTVKGKALNARKYPAFVLRLLNNGDVQFENFEKEPIWLLKGWRDMCPSSDLHGRRRRGHLLMRATNEAWQMMTRMGLVEDCGTPLMSLPEEDDPECGLPSDDDPDPLLQDQHPDNQV